MAESVGVAVSRYDDFNVLGEAARQPKGNVGLFTCFRIFKVFDALNHYDYFVWVS